MEKLVTIAILPVGLAVLIVLIFPLPALALDILLAVDILFALVSLIIVLRTRKTVNLLLLPTLVFESGIFNGAVYIAFVKILNRGAEFDGRLIRFASFLFASSGGIIFLVMVSAILILFVIMAVSVIIRVIVITKRTTRVAARFNLVSIKKAGFFSSLGSFVKFLSADGKLYLLIIGGFLINALLNVKFDDTEILTYPLVFGSGILFMLPFLLVFIAGCIATVSKAVEAVKPKEEQEMIQSIRQELARDLPPAIIATHLAEIIKCHAAEIQDLQEREII